MRIKKHKWKGKQYRNRKGKKKNTNSYEGMEMVHGEVKKR